MNRLLLIDGSYYVYRSFFAMSSLCSPRGEPSGAIYGFFKAVEKMLRHVRPTHAAVVWDGYPKRRHDLQPGYKGQREGRCEDMTAQWPVIEALVPMMGLKSVRNPDAESDDVMASYAMAAWTSADLAYDPPLAKWDTILATADKDLLACVNESTFIYSTSKADKGEAEYALIDEDAVIKKWGVKPNRITDILALTGDASDNIEGIKGVGPKTAAKWIDKHGSAIKAAMIERDTEVNKVSHNIEMITLEPDLPLPLPLESLTIGERTQDFQTAMNYYAINS